MITAVIAAASLATLPFELDPLAALRQRLTVGPSISVHAMLSHDGFGGMASIGGEAALFDRWIVPDPVCEARRADERRRLGADHVEAWDKVLQHAQQPCRAIEEAWFPKVVGGLELGAGIGAARHLQLRGWLSPLGWRQLMLGISVATMGSEDTEGLHVGLRLGPELSGVFRFATPTWKPMLTLFLRGEATVVDRVYYPDQVVLGVRFTTDILDRIGKTPER